MSSKRVLMKGFYGYANFGDDVLMVVTHDILRRALPKAEITLMTAASNASYVASLLPDVTVQTPNPRSHFDLIVHGGGGVFFDFLHHGFAQRILEKLLMASGFKNYLRFEKIARGMLNRPRITTTCRVGLGIGVGGFSAGSPYLRSRLHMLAEFDALWLRDAQSARELERFASVMHDARIMGSDLAFLTQHWLPENLPPRLSTARPRLGIALRDWAGMDEGVLTEMIATLAKDYDISGFILDAKHDPAMQRLLANYPLHIWQPSQMSIAEFVSPLSQMDVLLTSRAHAAICGACVGVPSVIVDIEPKMQQVHAMLPSSSRLVPIAPASDWPKAITETLKISPAAIVQDVARNRASSAAALDNISRWLV